MWKVAITLDFGLKKKSPHSFFVVFSSVQRIFFCWVFGVSKQKLLSFERACERMWKVVITFDLVLKKNSLHSVFLWCHLTSKGFFGSPKTKVIIFWKRPERVWQVAITLDLELKQNSLQSLFLWRSGDTTYQNVLYSACSWFIQFSCSKGDILGSTVPEVNFERTCIILNSSKKTQKSICHS